MSPYFSYFRARGLETRVVGDEEVASAGPDPLTRSYFFAQVAKRFWQDPLMDDVAWDWDRLCLRNATAQSGGWVPRIDVREMTISLPSSIGHNAPALGNLFDTRIRTLVDVFEVFGTTAPRPSTASVTT